MESDPMDVERARIALEEYKIRNAELLQRNTVLTQISPGAIAAIIGLISIAASGHLGFWATAVLIAAVIVLVLATWRFVDAGARQACSRLMEIRRLR